MNQTVNEVNQKIWDEIFVLKPPVSSNAPMVETEDGNYTQADAIGYDDEQKSFAAVSRIIDTAIKTKQYKTYRVGEVFVETYNEDHAKILPFDVIFLFSRAWEEPLFPVLVRTVTENKLTVMYLGGEENEDVITETIDR